jgi:hypothetical protein
MMRTLKMQQQALQLWCGLEGLATCHWTLLQLVQITVKLQVWVGQARQDSLLSVQIPMGRLLLLLLPVELLSKSHSSCQVALLGALAQLLAVAAAAAAGIAMEMQRKVAVPAGMAVAPVPWRWWMTHHHQRAWCLCSLLMPMWLKKWVP